MIQAFHEIVISTRGRSLQEFTPEVEQWIGRNKFKDGLLTLHLRLVPDGDPLFIHTTEGGDDMPAHIRTALTAVNLGIPLRGGQLALGTWQGIYLWEHRARPHSRRVALHFIGE